MRKKIALFCMFCMGSLYASTVFSQNSYELTSGWKCSPIGKVKLSGEEISTLHYAPENWMDAVVPGTVLTTLLKNKQVPDPFYGMNNEKIPDIYFTGRDYYTYWFINDFKEKLPVKEEQVWLHFRGINYSCDVFLNGKKINKQRHYGMFLRQSYNITSRLNKSGNNRLAVIIYPPEMVGNPNGGQGGDGTIAKNVSSQYVAGWDWIQPIRDRNTGIWDKVLIEKTQSVNIQNPHVITLVPGKRKVDGTQQPAIIKVTTELENASATIIKGKVQYEIGGQTSQLAVTIRPNSVEEIRLPDLIMKNPRLWWPNGYGPQNLYPSNIKFIANNARVSDEEQISVGIREIQTSWNAVTKSRQLEVNGQKIFIKGGNWIISDAMLRFSEQRYDAEIHFHRDMNLNLIRIWGGALPERPEFYNACDKYGLLVMQDFGMSGDCNGRWEDPMKKEDQWTRRKYPDDHQLFLRSAADMVTMIRNHPSLAFWCGGNEITPPDDIFIPLRDSIIARLDGTRWWVDYSNSDSMSYNSIGGNGDGPYSIQDINSFWQNRTFPFNSEIGSIGIGDYASLERFIPPANMNPPLYPSKQIDSIWNYHKYIGYDQYIEPYGKVKNIRDFTQKAQLVNYDQYRALSEGFTSHMWDWYTGFIIWKTQNPWTAMRGQMYDYYLDVNACLYGLRSGNESLHVMCNPADGMITLVNNGMEAKRNLMLVCKIYDLSGKITPVTQVFTYIEPSSVKKIFAIKETLDKAAKEKGCFLDLQLLDENKNILCDNFYWYPDASRKYSGLQSMEKAEVKISAKLVSEGKIEVMISNPLTNTVAFFNRVSLVDEKTKLRILPAFFSDNYFSVVPGAVKKIVMESPVLPSSAKLMVTINGWNVQEQYVELP